MSHARYKYARCQTDCVIPGAHSLRPARAVDDDVRCAHHLKSCIVCGAPADPLTMGTAERERGGRYCTAHVDVDENAMFRMWRGAFAQLVGDTRRTAGEQWLRAGEWTAPVTKPDLYAFADTLALIPLERLEAPTYIPPGFKLITAIEGTILGECEPNAPASR